MRFGVAMISQTFYPFVGGAQTHTLRLSQKLRALGVDARVITRYYPGLARYEEVGGVPTFRAGRGGRSKAIGMPFFVLEALRLIYARRAAFDVLHSHMMFSAMVVGLLVRPLTRQPVVINPHGRGPLGDIGVLTNRPALTGQLPLAAARRWGSAFVCISQEVREELIGVGIDEGRLWDIVNGVDTDHFSPASKAKRATLRRSLNLPFGPLVVFAGRLAPIKGLDVLLAAWPQVSRSVPQSHLLILGEGEERANLETQAQRLDIADRVTFVGGCHDVAPYLRAADVFALPSHSEASPVALLEAMASGLPSVATATPGAKQALEDGATGRLVSIADPSALASALIEALTTPEAQQWGAQARQHIIEHHSLDVIAKRYITMYETLLHSGNSL
jgi:glycosyltransferase involved in cell wall biosynthesis